MRNALLYLFLILLSSAGLKAQNWPENGFQLSLTLEPERERFVNLTPWVTASDTLRLPPPDNFGFSPRREIDTISINGVTAVYYTDPVRRGMFRRNQALWEILTSIRLHYRFNKFEAGLGFVYSDQVNKPRTSDIDDLPEDFFYSSFESRRQYAALLSQFSYHPSPQSRVSPYVGIRLRTGISQFTATGITLVFPNTGQELDALERLSPRFRQNTVLDFNLRLLAGVNFRINNRWMVGIEGSLSRYLIPKPRGLQIRYAIGVDRYPKE